VAEVVDVGARTCATPARPTASRSVLLIVSRQPGANIIETVDRVQAHPAAAARRRSRADRPGRGARTAPPTIRASLRDVERTLADRRWRW
jgi:multidrug efflux pump